MPRVRVHVNVRACPSLVYVHARVRISISASFLEQKPFPMVTLFKFGGSISGGAWGRPHKLYTSGPWMSVTQ
jgi:hypothetical protein